MVRSCSAYNCTSRYEKGNGISFYSFPRDPEMRKKWIIATKRKNFVPTPYSALCSKHFTNDHYQVRPYCNVELLRPDAVPTVFDFPPHLQIAPPPKRITVGRNEMERSSIERRGRQFKMWSREAMIQAIIAVRNNTMGVNRAEKLFNVPKTSLRRYMKMLETDPSETVRIRARRRPIIIEELEKRLGIRQGRSSQDGQNLIKPNPQDTDITIIDDAIAEDEEQEHFDESLPNGVEPDIDLAPMETLQMPEFCVAESPQPDASSFSVDDEECTAMGAHFACQLRAMSEDQRLLAQRAIADVLYFGRLGRLSENCFIFQPTLIP